ncbi:MAG TPA: peptidase S10, partial [Methylocella sp.]
MPNILKWLLAAVLFGFAATSPTSALEPPAAETAIGPAAKAGQQNGDAGHAQAPPAAAPNSLPAAATTSHTIELPGRSLRFKAIAGPIRLSDAESLAPKADIATTAFILEGADSAKRPVTFAINGGPGAASAWLDLGAMGPWRLPLDRASPSPSAPPVTIDNADTWLDFTDLVFIDPPGTGYSRILAKGEETRRHLYSVN